jgi:signal transduction histidine kinase
MFRLARIKLTAWYLLIIMLISVSFSLVTYRILSSELNRIERMQVIRTTLLFPNPGSSLPRFVAIDPQLIVDAKNRLKIILTLINVSIFAASTAAGYFLAGKTLKPIQDMVDDQNRFISDASHELRTPLTCLKSEIEVNLRDKKLTLKDAKNTLKSNLEEVNNLQNLSNYLLKLNRFNHNLNLELKPISLLTIIDSAIKKVSPIAKDKNIKIINSTADLYVRGDSISLIEALVILLDNAIKYSSKNTEIKINLQDRSGILSLNIKDQGIGISEGDLPHIFDRFYRADNARTKNQSGGYGLGLSIAKKIIEAHHGRIEVESKLGQGTKFTILLPKLS